MLRYKNAMLQYLAKTWLPALTSHPAVRTACISYQCRQGSRQVETHVASGYFPPNCNTTKGIAIEVPMKSNRAKAILSMVDADTDTANNCEVENATTRAFSPWGEWKKKKKVDPVLEAGLNKLYARPFSMTLPVFDQFCETQTTRKSHHFHDLESHLVMLKDTFQPSSLKSQELPATARSAPDCLERTVDLTCHEIMLLSNSSPQEQLCIERRSLDPRNKRQNSNNMTLGLPMPNTELASFDYDSDDSVLDKDYIPSDSSQDSDDDETATCSKQKLLKTKKFSVTSSTEPAPSLSLQLPFKIAKDKTKKRRLTFDFSEIRCAKDKTKKRRLTFDSSEIRCPESEINSYTGREIVNESNLNCNNTNALHATNGEEIRVPTKKRRYDTSLADRKKEKKNIKRMEYAVKSGCNEICLKKCSTKFDETDRETINKEYWSLKWQERKLYVKSRTEVAVPKRKYTTEPKRKPKRSFRLHARNGTAVEVCKKFFLTTLGYKQNNDQVLRIDIEQSTSLEGDKRGKHQKTPLFDRAMLNRHVESFNPAAPHYRREHAPLRRYLPSDINITKMYNDFCQKHPGQTVSYELYRKHVKNMKISFTQLGNEECEACETYKLHKRQSDHDFTTQFVADCSTCVEYSKHHERYTKARQLYAFHKTFPQSKDKVFFTADLEKVIMLPRMDTFKSVIFAQRLVVFNQTFAPVGKITTENKPVTVIWHDGIAGRKQEDIMSAFYSFIIRNRDVRKINIWLDNCSAQNKNWLLYSLLVHLVNSDLITTTNISLHYFEPGHTFMSADQVHHQVELSMKKIGKIYDFTDFKDAVSSINNGKVSVESLTPHNFLNIPNFVSDRRIQKSQPRAYLKNMVQVTFQRSNFGLIYKNDFDDEFTVLQFMNDKYLKNPSLLTVTFRTSPKGIDQQRKAGIVDKLETIIPTHKLQFWKNLPTTDL